MVSGSQLLLVLLAHLLLLIWLSREMVPSLRLAPRVGVAFGLPIGLSRAPAGLDAPHPPAPAQLPAPEQASPSPEPSAAPEAEAKPAPPGAATPAVAGQATTGPRCPDPDALPRDLQKALTEDATVRQALAHIPARTLSVAHAAVVWEGGWVDPASFGGAENLDSIRRVVLTELVKTRPACLTEAVQGPRLLIVAGPADSTVLAVGSGVWAWRDLLDVTRVPDSAPPS